MVENPIISNYVDDVLSKIHKEAREQGLPIFVQKTTPKLEESFWINVLGKGIQYQIIHLDGVQIV
jgi:DNA sulfur modification protein DndC